MILVLERWGGRFFLGSGPTAGVEPVAAMVVNTDRSVGIGDVVGLGNSTLFLVDDNTQQIIVDGALGAFEGIKYAQNFSGQFVNRSLVDKEYVDNLVASSSSSTLVTADNGLMVNPANNVRLGGGLTQNTVVNQNGFNLGFTDNNFSVLNTTNQPYLSSGGPSTFDRFTGVANVVGTRSMLSGLVNTGGIDYLTFRNYFDDGVNQTTSFLHALDSGLNFGHESVGGTTVVSQFIVDTSGVNFLSTQAGSSGGVNIQPGGSIQFSGVNGGNSGQFTIDTTSPSSEWRINAGANQAGIIVDQSTIRMQTQGSNRFFIDSVGDIRMHQYPNTRDDGGAPVNVLSTDVTGYVQSRPIASLLGGAWQLLGNAGTNAAVNFLGTTDAQDLAFRTNNLEQLRITQAGRFLAPNATDNIFIDGGNETMTGTSNIGIGDGAVGQNITGISNIALGQNALLFNTTGFSNMAIGQATLLFNNGNTNTAIGQGAGIVSTGNSNTYIGYGAGNTQSSGDNNIIIGQLANAGNNTGSNQLSIGNWIYGDNGNIGIGQPLPTERLDVLGNLRLDGAFMPGNNAGGSNQVLLSQGAGVAPIWVATSSLGLVGALVTADNGLTVNPANNVQLGGRLLQNTSIEINDGFGGFSFEVGPNAGETLFKVDNGTQTASLGDDNGWSTGTVIEADVQNNQLRFSTNLLERMRIDASGNVGIGTTTSSERLQVNGNLRLDGAFMPNNNAGLLGEVLVSQGSGLAPVWTPNTPSNIYTTSGILNSDRDVSLNGYYLQIADAATDTLFYIDDSTVAFLSDNAGETALVDVISTGAGAEVRMELQGTNPAEFQLDNQSGVARGTFSSSGGYGIQYLGFGESNQDNTLNNANYGTLQNNSLVPRSYVDGLFAQNIIQNGNSFGTTTVIGTNDVQNFSFETNNTQRANFRADNAFGLELFNIDTTNRYAYTIRNTTNNLNYSLWDGVTQDWLLGFNDNQFLVIDRTDNRDMMRITKGGGVYNTAIGDSTTASGNTISFLNNNAGYTNTTIGINSSRKFFITDGSAVRLWVKPSNVLSTDTANYESLVVADNDIPNRRFVFNNFFAQNGNAFGGLATIGTTDSNDVRIVASSTEGLRILTTGNVLANAIMPNGPYGSNVSNYDLGSTTSRWREVWTNIINVGGASTWSLVNNATRLDFSAGASGSGAERMTFLTGGEVGIGNTAPTDRLHVGNASGPSVRISVDSATQAGLVFKEGGTARWSFIHGDLGNGAFGLLNHFNSSYALSVSSTSNIGLSNNNPLFILHTGSSSIISGTTVARFENAGGTCDVTPNVAGGITCTSDQNLKKDIESIDPIDSLQKLLAVEVKSYRMNADTYTSTKQTGFLAQQLEIQFPGLVLTSIEGTKSVSYAGMTPILTQAVQTIYKFFADIGVVVENGVAKVNEFVANRVRTKELCVGEEGDETCITKGQLDALLSGQGVAAAPVSGINNDSQGGSQGQSGTTTDSVASSTDPVVDPSPVEPAPEQPTDPVAADPVVDQTPVDPTPTETTPTEPAPLEEAPVVDPSPVDPAPTE